MPMVVCGYEESKSEPNRLDADRSKANSNSKRCNFSATLRNVQSYWERLWPVALLCFAACLPYINSLPNAFHFDDFPEIVDNEGIRSFENLLGARPLGRWLVYATYAVNYSVHGLDWMPGWHIVNILLHAGCVLAFYGLMKDLPALWSPAQLRSRSTTETPASADAYSPSMIAFCAALIFAVHPLASEPINYIEARCVLMYTLFSLLATRIAIGIVHQTAFTKKGLLSLAFLGFVVLASVSKPVGLLFAIALPMLYFLIFVLPYRSYQRRQILWRAGIAGGIGLVAVIWMTISDVWIVLSQRLQSNVWSYFWAQTVVFWRYIGLAIFPLPGCLNVDHDVAFRSYSPKDPEVFVAILGLVVLFLVPAFYLVRKKPLISFLLFAIPLGVFPYFFLSSAEMMVEYRFYLPLTAFCGLLGVGASWLVNRCGRSGHVVFCILLAFMAIACMERNRAWHTDLSLWKDAVRKSPRKARTLNALAWALLKDPVQSDPRRGLELAMRSLDCRYVDLPPIYNPYMVDTLAEAFFLNGDVEKAIQIEQEILERKAGDPRYFCRQLERYKAHKNRQPPSAMSP